MRHRTEVPAEDRALEGGDAVRDGVLFRFIDGYTEGDDGRNEFWGAVLRGVVERPRVDVVARDDNVVVDVKDCVGGTKDRPEAGGVVEDDAAPDVALLSTAEKKWGEEVGEGGVCTRENAEVASRKDFSDFENHFVWNTCEGHADVMVLVVVVVVLRQRVQTEP